MHSTAHYESEHQPIETMQENMSTLEFIGFLRGNIIKYACRMGKKGEALADAEKMQRYADWLVKTIRGEVVNPRD